MKALSSVERTMGGRPHSLNPLNLALTELPRPWKCLLFSSTEEFVLHRQGMLLCSGPGAQMFCVCIYVCVVYFFKIGRKGKSRSRMVPVVRPERWA